MREHVTRFTSIERKRRAIGSKQQEINSTDDTSAISDLKNSLSLKLADNYALSKINLTSMEVSTFLEVSI